MTLSSGKQESGNWRLSLATSAIGLDGEPATVFVGIVDTPTGQEVVIRADNGKAVLLKDNKAIILSALLHQAFATRQVTTNRHQGAQP